MDFLADFIDCMTQKGCAAADIAEIIADDKRRRYRLADEAKGKRSGSYQLKMNGDYAVGWFRSFREGVTHKYISKPNREFTAEERNAWKKKAEAARDAQAKVVKEAQAKAGIMARKIWERASKEGESEYLKQKGINKLHGARIYKGAVCVPISIGGEIKSLQFIAPDKKRMLTNGEIAGGYFGIARSLDDFSIIFICEGFSTGATIREAMNMPVVCAMFAGNLEAVAMAIRKKYPNARIVFAADNDAFTTNARGEPENVGIIKAQAAAVKIGGAAVIYPEFAPEHQSKENNDFNDAFRLYGYNYVKDRISQALSNAGDSMAGGGEEFPICENAQSPASSHQYDGEENYTIKTEYPFKILGHNDGHYYFFPKNSGQIVSIGAGGLGSIVSLFRLAPMEYWDSNFNHDGKQGSRKIAEFAANALMSEAHRIGIFRPQNVRGIGVWLDEGKPVVHCGDRLLVNDKEYSPHDFKSKYVYPQREATFEINSEPLTNKESIKLREICTDLSWDTKLSGELLAGWLVIAPVCAALKWRPHIWVQGESQSGKSTVMDDIITPILGNTVLRFDGGTSEAGIRQIMGIDARPIIYDEAEGETQKDRGLMEGVLQLVRRASSGGKIVKGGQSGDAVQYTIRSAFCFSAINPMVKHRADESRISQLVLRRANFPDADLFYQELIKRIRETLTESYAQRLLARTIKNLPTLLKNSTVFTDAAAKVLCDRRAADQIGSMLAGLYLLTSTKEIEPEKAVEWIKLHDWTSHTTIAEDSDPQRLITQICTLNVRYKINAEDSIGNLIVRALGKNEGASVEDADAMKYLRNIGIWPRIDGVIIANKSPPLSRLLNDTPWVSWKRPLMDILGSELIDALRFTPGINSRGVKVELSAFGL